MANNPPSTTIIVLPLKESVHEARLQLTYAYKCGR